MASDRMAKALRTLDRDAGSGLAAVCARALDSDGVAVSLVLENSHAELVWCSGPVSASFEDLQFTLGEGPGPDAIRSGAVVQVRDLGRVAAERWPALLPAVGALAVGSVCCFPLVLGAIRLGVLTVIRHPVRALSAGEVDDALVLASALTALVLDGGAGAPRQDGLEAPRVLHRTAVHQATGMISVQLGVPLAEALLRLRAHAYASSRPVNEIAQDVVTRRLRFHDDETGSRPPDGPRG
ncbi:GAF and ANTAR domain-containing protein [Streptomyces polyrhachis]|uniref:GAF and ANTAR domain-containing protein n=1 Tax=Streptomyces polyrhachis TaxID=1282885 RepID=A0ABW2GEN4_9ACTN